MNLVRESISFERGKDPKDMLGIGENYFKQKLIDMIPLDNPKIGKLTPNTIIKILKSQNTHIMFHDDLIIISGQWINFIFSSSLINRLNLFKWQVDIISHNQDTKKLVLKRL
jgi:hypothetical protein